MRKAAFFICENKGADKLCSAADKLCLYCTADQGFCFDTDPSSSFIRNFKPIAIFLAVHTSLCWAWSETPKAGFLITLTSAHLK